MNYAGRHRYQTGSIEVAAIGAPPVWEASKQQYMETPLASLLESENDQPVEAGFWPTGP